MPEPNRRNVRKSGRKPTPDERHERIDDSPAGPLPASSTKRDGPGPSPGRGTRTGPRQSRPGRPTPHRRAYHLIVNQAAGNDPYLPLRLARKLERRQRRAGWDCHIHSARTWDEYTQAAARAVQHRPVAVVVFGGDGAVRIAAAQVARSRGLLGIIPCGRHNNIFRSLYGHTDPDEAMDIVRSHYQMRIDAGLANGKFFLGSLVTGLMPVLIDRLGPKKLPRLGLTWSKLAARSADDTMPQTATIKVDAYTFKAQPLILQVHLLSHFLSLQFAPVATPDDGRLVLIYDPDGARDVVVQYLKELRKNRYQYSDGIQIIRGRRMAISPAAGRVWLIDGDPVEFTGDELNIEALPQVLRVFSNVKEK